MENVTAFSGLRVHESPLTCISAAGPFVLCAIYNIDDDQRCKLGALLDLSNLAVVERERLQCASQLRPWLQNLAVCRAWPWRRHRRGYVITVTPSSPSSSMPTCWFPCVRSDLCWCSSAHALATSSPPSPTCVYSLVLLSSCRPWLRLHHPQARLDLP